MFAFRASVCLLAAFAISHVFGENSVFSIYKDNDPWCAGAVVSTFKNDTLTEMIMLTAAKCVHRIQASRLTVSINSTGQAARVSRVVVHPYYKPPNVDYNVAVLKAVKPTESTDNINRLPLSKNKIPDFNGLFTVEDPNPKPNVKLVEWKACQPKVGIPLSSKMICAAVQKVQNGAALITDKNELAGVAFFSGQDPTVFTNIANPEIRCFIEKHIEKPKEPGTTTKPTETTASTTTTKQQQDFKVSGMH